MRLKIAVLLTLIVSGPVWAADAPTFYKDAKSGCEVGTFYPKSGTTVTWTGPCVNGKVT